MLKIGQKIILDRDLSFDVPVSSASRNYKKGCVVIITADGFYSFPDGTKMKIYASDGSFDGYDTESIAEMIFSKLLAETLLSDIVDDNADDNQMDSKQFFIKTIITELNKILS